MANPLKTLHIRRLTLAYWHGWRFWAFRPRIERYWLRGELVHVRWLCFDVGWDGRKDWLADMMGEQADGE